MLRSFDNDFGQITSRPSEKWYGQRKFIPLITVKSGTANYIRGRTSLKTSTATAVLAVLVAPPLAVGYFLSHPLCIQIVIS
jgi:hypothetical protein